MKLPTAKAAGSITAVVGAIVAGGLGTRMGGSKAAREVAGRPLVAWPAAALRLVCPRVMVVAKPSSEVPVLEGVERVDEPESPIHPAVGILHALTAAGEEVLVCAADMPFVTAEALRALVAAGVREYIGSTPVPSRMRSVAHAYAASTVSESRPAMCVTYTDS